jgi:hypothetical protein
MPTQALDMIAPRRFANRFRARGTTKNCPQIYRLCNLQRISSKIPLWLQSPPASGEASKILTASL